MLQLAERYLIAEAQAGLDTGKIPSLLPETGTFPGFTGELVNIILVGGREKSRYRIGYDLDGVPVLPHKSPLAYQ